MFPASLVPPHLVFSTWAHTFLTLLEAKGNIEGEDRDNIRKFMTGIGYARAVRTCISSRRDWHCRKRARMLARTLNVSEHNQASFFTFGKELPMDKEPQLV